MENETYVLTLQKVKDCIGFQPGEAIRTTLCNMVDLWYEQAKANGAADEAAAGIALEKLGNKLLEMGEGIK